MRSRVAIRSLLFLVVLMALSAASNAQIGISVSFGPPALPVYEQPICPGDGFMWTPGYWAYGDDDYYWVPGTWIEPPQVGFLWTPGYWGWGGSAFFFHEGYWGAHVGFYGGINYGFGYGGVGYLGGRWENNHFFYNTNVNRINETIIHNTYNTRIENVTVNHISYNGGNGGINARASAEEEGYARERHIGPVAAQNEHVQQARGNPELRAAANHGRPPIAATARAGDFKGGVAAREAGGEYKAPERGAGNNHASEVQSHKYTAPSSGNPDTDKKYQQKQDNLAAKQNQEHQRLQQKQENEHQQAAKKNATDAQKTQMEQRHTQQTKQLEQKHTQQQQKLQTRQSPPPSHAPSGKH
jgi:hypothetical protein